MYQVFKTTQSKYQKQSINLKTTQSQYRKHHKIQKQHKI